VVVLKRVKVKKLPDENLSKEFIEKWKHLLSEIEMQDVPIEYIERLELYFNNGQKPAFIDVTKLLEQDKSWRIEKKIEEELVAIDDILDRVDFHLNFDKVVTAVDAATTETLKKI